VVPPLMRAGLIMIVGFPPLMLNVAVSVLVVVFTVPGKLWFPVLQFWLPPVCVGIQLWSSSPFQLALPPLSGAAGAAASDVSRTPAVLATPLTVVPLEFLPAPLSAFVPLAPLSDA
jgi:hypothetical protein